jgi:Fic family protein
MLRMMLDGATTCPPASRQVTLQVGRLLEDVGEASNYVAAPDHGLHLLEQGLPLSLRLFREIDGVLLSKGRGSHQAPGEFRRSQNWIGGTRPANAAFVPPPAEEVLACMGRLELFLHDRPEPTPVLLKAALLHVQFETIHPLLDGNGRLGRPLITLLLCKQKVLREPVLYLSLYVKTHRRYYYELLDKVHRTGDWEAWLEFFAEAIIVTATQAVETAQQLLVLSSRDRGKIGDLGRAAASALQVHRALMERPISTSGCLVEKTAFSPATVNKALAHRERLGIVKELSARKRNRLFSYTAHIEIMNQGTDLPGG